MAFVIEALCRILCTNRDEYLSRPTENAHFHSFGLGPEGSSQASFVLSGRDLQAGGTWLGLNRAGRVAVLSVTKFHYAQFPCSATENLLSSNSTKRKRHISGPTSPSRPRRTSYPEVNSCLRFSRRMHQIWNNSHTGWQAKRRLSSLASISFCSHRTRMPKGT